MSSPFVQIIIFPMFLIFIRIVERILILDNIYVFLIECCCFVAFFSIYQKNGGVIRSLSRTQLFSRMIVGIFVGVFVSGINRAFALVSDQNFSFLSAVVICLVSPINEELIYRGFVMDELDKWASPTISDFLSAGLFAVAHSSVLQIVTSFLTGLLLARLRHNDKTILSPVLVHSTANITLWSLLLKNTAS